MAIVNCPECQWCHTPSTLELPDDMAARAQQWIDKREKDRHNVPFIQVAFPNLNADQREQMLTGTHSACWDEMFKEEDEDEGN